MTISYRVVFLLGRKKRRRITTITKKEETGNRNK